MTYENVFLICIDVAGIIRYCESTLQDHSWAISRIKVQEEKNPPGSTMDFLSM